MIFTDLDNNSFNEDQKFSMGLKFPVDALRVMSYLPVVR